MIRRDGILAKVEELRVTLPGLTALALDGFVDTQKDGLQFDGNVVMRSADLDEFVRWLRPGGQTFTETVPGAVALNGTLRVRPNKIDVTNALVDIAGERLDGSFTYDATSPRPRTQRSSETGAFDLGARHATRSNPAFWQPNWASPTLARYRLRQGKRPACSMAWT